MTLEPKAAPMSAPYVGEKIVSLIAEEPRAARILDIATGQGYLLRHLQKAGFSNFTCVDIDDQQFREDKAVNHFVNADVNQPLPFADGSFDLVISSETIEHVENPRAFVRELKRVMADNGSLILTTPNISTIASRLLFLMLGHLDGHREGDYAVSGHVTVLPDWALSRIFSEEGLVIEAKTYNCAYIPYLSRWPAMRFKKWLLNRAFGWIVLYRLKKGPPAVTVAATRLSP